MIEIQKENPKYPEVDPAFLTYAVETTFGKLDKPEMDITLRLTSDAEVRQMNQKFRNVAKTTDVLAFNQNFINPETDRIYLGDIIVSIERALQQAAANGHTLAEECAFLAIHGTLHLLGYDHYSPDEKAEMWKLQDEVFNIITTTYKERQE